MTDDKDVLSFACPHCGGPLHVVDNGDVACEREHRFTVGEVLLEQTRTSARATWLAVAALRERARASRWAAGDPDLYGVELGDSRRLESSATQDEATAAQLQVQAQMLDLTLWRISRGTEGDGTPLKDPDVPEQTPGG